MDPVMSMDDLHHIGGIVELLCIWKIISGSHHLGG